MRRRTASALAAASCVLALSCARQQQAEPADQAGNAPVVDAATRITMERLPCFGTCPVYTIAITGDGAVTYNGVAHVDTMGSASARIPPARVAELVSALVTGGFFEFADRYIMNEKACGNYHTDAPRVNTTVVYGGRTKRVEHDYGCGGAPDALRRLEARIDSTAVSRRWVGR